MTIHDCMRKATLLGILAALGAVYGREPEAAQPEFMTPPSESAPAPALPPLRPQLTVPLPHIPEPEPSIIKPRMDPYQAPSHEQERYYGIVRYC